MVPGFKRGVPCMLKVTYIEKNATTYHRYAGGDVWVPTAPDDLARPDQILHISIELFGLDDFFSHYPNLMLENDARLRYMSEKTVIEVRRNGLDLTLAIQQLSPIGDDWKFQLKGRLIDSLVFQTGSIFCTFLVTDSFGVERGIRLYHNGFTRVGLAIEAARDYFRVQHLSFDGFRLSLAYRYGNWTSITSLYLKQPSSLYRIGNMREISHGIPVKGISDVFLVDRVELLRDHEKVLVSSGRNYHIGRVGAEIAYTIALQKFGCENLVIEEPAKGGTDIHSRDLRVAVEARLMSHIRPATLGFEISRQMERLSHKVRSDFRRTPAATVGYAIFSYVEFGEIRSIIAQIMPERRKRED